ncbi:MAG: ABC transporter permease [Candidatus Methylomirabilota bacterium]
MSYPLANALLIWRLTLEHLQISAVSCLLAILTACPLGVLVGRVRWLAPPVLAAAGIFYTIPSVALFAILIPVLGLGVKPTVLALVLYSQLALIRNTAVGINEVDAALLQAAQGMGMTNTQRFWRVEVPLAIPVIFAGVRTATVMAIGLASIAAYIGAGGLGVLIFQGISTGNTDQILTGAVAVSILALLADAILSSIQHVLRWAMGVRA